MISAAQELLLVTTLVTNVPTGGEPLGGVAVDGAGNVYVGDDITAIWKITPKGEFGVFAGNPTNAGYADGTSTQARFNMPNGVAVDAAGNVFVADWGIMWCRKITPAGVVSTYAGVPGGYGPRTGQKPPRCSILCEASRLTI